MTPPTCERIGPGDLIDYATGELSEPEATALEDHLFACPACGARAAELEALVRATNSAARSGTVGGFVTDAVLNQLARDGVRVRTFTLSPGAIVPCAVWDDDEVMALRLRAELGGEGEITLSQRVAGEEVRRATGHLLASSHGEVVYAEPAAMVRQLPAVDVELVLSVHDGGEERIVASYTLMHAGALHRR
jgi:anti-sigma factor RsiW